eukprot:593875-Prymnesium_polylepis.1
MTKALVREPRRRDPTSRYLYKYLARAPAAFSPSVTVRRALPRHVNDFRKVMATPPRRSRRGEAVGNGEKPPADAGGTWTTVISRRPRRQVEKARLDG